VFFTKYATGRASAGLRLAELRGPQGERADESVCGSDGVVDVSQRRVHHCRAVRALGHRLVTVASHRLPVGATRTLLGTR
jgi:hypothetical protein